MYLVNRLCHLKFHETATHFVVKTYGIVCWACLCAGLGKQTTDPRFKKRVEQEATLIKDFSLSRSLSLN
ncbi:MAG: hypothetical protein H0W49_15920 [Nitrospirales bacterium]|nr:hypothetical protein [Nitrospirales bacterium]MBA3964702.1 hypothetical protein [Nitrospirales bacterium]